MVLANKSEAEDCLAEEGVTKGSGKLIFKGNAGYLSPDGRLHTYNVLLPNNTEWESVNQIKPLDPISIKANREEQVTY